MALDSFWTLAAELTHKKIKFRFIGLTATLRTDDVIDIMKRLGTSAMRVSRTSCYREGLIFEFKIVGTSDDSMREAEKVVNSGGERGKILIFVTGIETCVELGARLQKSYKGCGSVICLYCDMSSKGFDIILQKGCGHHQPEQGHNCCGRHSCG